MAEAFPRNPDDVELWLPSDLYPDVEVRRRPEEPPPELAYVDRFVQQLAAYGLLDGTLRAPAHGPAPKLSPRLIPEAFGPVVRFGPPRQLLCDGFRGPVAGSNGYGSWRSRVGPLSVGRSVQVVGGFGQGRGRVFWGNEPNRFSAARRGGSGSKCVGTGVFLPRVVQNAEGKANAGSRVQEQEPAENAVEKGMSCHSPSETALPQDWTY